MKSTIPLCAAFVAMTSVCGSGFTLDAAGYDGAELPPNPSSIRIAGYGEVIFESDNDRPIVVNSGYRRDTPPPNPEFDFDPTKVVKIVVTAHETRTENLIFGGVPESRQPEIALTDVRHDFVGLKTDSDAPRPYGIPETASAILGLLGTALLLLRRLR